MVMLGASNLRQQRRLWTVLGRPEMIKRSNEEHDVNHEREVAALTEIMLTCSAEEWEEFLQARHVPAARVRTMADALADPQLAGRGIIHRHPATSGIEGALLVPLAAFTYASVLDGHAGALRQRLQRRVRGVSQMSDPVLVPMPHRRARR
jgi:crotonobetainyl-CoA:carnitine CoA-transferase CaiB-like acyl-CoA transferase